MKQNFNFAIQQLHERGYPVLPPSVALGVAAKALGYSKEVCAVLDAGDRDRLVKIMGPAFARFKTFDEVMVAANVALLHVGNQGYGYWYRIAQLYAARKALKPDVLGTQGTVI